MVTPMRSSGLLLRPYVCQTKPTTVRPCGSCLLAVSWELFSCAGESVSSGYLFADDKTVMFNNFPESRWFIAELSAEVNSSSLSDTLNLWLKWATQWEIKVRAQVPVEVPESGIASGDLVILSTIVKRWVTPLDCERDPLCPCVCDRSIDLDEWSSVAVLWCLTGSWKFDKFDTPLPSYRLAYAVRPTRTWQPSVLLLPWLKGDQGHSLYRNPGGAK